MAKGLPRSLKKGLQTKVIRVNAVAIEVDGATGVGFGSAVVGDFPEGNILLLGAAAYLQFTTASASVQAAFDGDYALGTTATADATVTGTDANITTLAALGAATAKVSPVVRGISAAPAAPLNNTDGSLEVNLNLIIDDANISADDVAFTVSGVIELAYVVLLDNA
jgi:hypothetical protein